MRNALPADRLLLMREISSFTIDTACSGSLVSVDVACRYLQSKEISSAIVAASNLYFRCVKDVLRRAVSQEF